jgi:hypothetical protein
MSYDTEERLSAALQGIAGNRPYAPDIEKIESRGQSLRRSRVAWRTTVGTGVVAAVAAVAVATTGTSTQTPNLAGPKSGATTSSTSTQDAPLVHLVSYLSNAPKPTGDATLVLRDTVAKAGTKVDVWDLYADNGDYYFAKTRDGLPGQVKGKHTQQDKAGRQKTVAAAELAAKGDLNEARKQMALAYLPADPKVTPTLEAPGVVPSLSDGSKKKLGDGAQASNLTDNWVWNNSMDALGAGAGSPTVRAGVLRLLGQMPEVTVTKGTLDGQAVLTLAAGSPAVSDGESLTVNAETGLPIKFTSDGGGVNYTVTRVDLADVANGKF